MCTILCVCMCVCVLSRYYRKRHMSTAMRAHFAIQITKTVIEYLLK